jgi:hypothetical protein
MDGSPFLIVQAEDALADDVATVAEEIAMLLEARFLRETAIM